MSKSVWIKVCGVTRIADLDALSRAGVDAVGLNFVPTSPRYLEPARAPVFAARAAELGMDVVGVFMNPTVDQIATSIHTVGLSAVQLHGSESKTLADSCGQLPILKAVSWTGRAEEQQLVMEWRQILAERNRALEVCDGSDDKTVPKPSLPSSFLVDAYAPIQGGGSGKKARWDLLVETPLEFNNVPFVLAGGLNPSNVAQAIDQTACMGVDAASGVEELPGHKDHRLVQQFVAAVRES